MRRTKIVTIPGKHDESRGNRDNGKSYLITEMSAADAEAWALEALTLIAQAGINLPEGIANYGMAGMALVGLDSLMKVDFTRAQPLLKKMMDCVQFVPDPKRPMPRALDEANGTDIEEASTRFLLRDEVFELHTGFSLAGSIRGILEAAKNTFSPIDTPTSQTQSEPVSVAPST